MRLVVDLQACQGLSGSRGIGRFADAQITALSKAELEDLEKLLELRDQQVFDWIFGAQPLDPDYDTPLFRRLLAFHDGGKTIK